MFRNYSWCQNNVPFRAKSGTVVFFITTYQSEASPVPHGLVMKFCRFLVKLVSRNITNPSGHYAREVEST